MFLKQKPPLGARLNTSHPMANGLVGCWIMNEGSGDKVYDLSENGNLGVLINGPAWSAGGLLFDSFNDYVEMPANVVLNSGHITYSAWVRPDELPVSSPQFIVIRSNTNGGTAALMAHYTANKFAFQIRLDGTEGTARLVYSDVALVAGNWYHVVGTYDGIVQKLYINGVLQADTNVVGGNIDPDNIKVFTVGDHNAHDDANNVFGGLIEDISVYNRGLTASEVQAINSNQYAMFEPDPIWILRVDAAAGVSVSATTDALILTEYNPTINKEINFTAGVDALVLTEYAADVNINIDVSAGVDALVMTEYNPTVDKEVSFTAGIDALVIAEYEADVSLGVLVEAGVDELILTEYNPTINKEIGFTAGLDALILTEYNPDVLTGINVSAGLDELVLTKYNPVVNKEITFTAGLDELVLAEFNATVELAVVWSNITIQGLDAISGEVVYIIGKYKT